MLVAVTAVASVVALPRMASAESIFDFFFGGFQKQQQRQGQASFFADPFGLNQQGAPAPRAVASVSGPAFCVRSCDGKYFPLARGNATPVQMCQAFCPASATKVFFGSGIDSAYASLASATPTAKTPSPIARRCAPIAPATAVTPQVLRRLI
jgi:Protein of unknown function (DUF2865)